MKTVTLRWMPGLVLALLAGGMLARAEEPPVRPAQPASAVARPDLVLPMQIYPLPGGLDQQPMLNDNSPESLTGPGILVSTLPSKGSGETPFLGFAFDGDFGIFSHHLFSDHEPGKRMMYIGLVASNSGNKPVTLTLRQGATYQAYPDAPYQQPLTAVMANPAAQIYAGPGDRVATEMSAGKAPLQNQVFNVPPGSSQILSSEPIQTLQALTVNTPSGPQSMNSRSTLMQLHADGPVYLSALAWQAQRQGEGFVPPTLADYRSLLQAGKFAGKHEATSLYDDQHPPTGVFRYGRVAGVSPGVHWLGKLWQGERQAEIPAVGQSASYPIASTYIKRYGTGQNQSGKMLRRYSDSPSENHGNYGVDYQLEIPLNNATARTQVFKLSLHQPFNPNPGNHDQPSKMIFKDPPNGTLMFRGSVRLQWVDAQHQAQNQLIHLVLLNGQLSPAFASLSVPPGSHYQLRLNLIYPADVTPPQLLTIERVE